MWISVARTIKEAGYLNKKSNYQEMLLHGLREFEEGETRDLWIQDLSDLTENIFQIVAPDRYSNWQRMKRNKRKEEGVDEVIYGGGPSTQEEMEEMLREFGI